MPQLVTTYMEWKRSRSTREQSKNGAQKDPTPTPTQATSVPDTTDSATDINGETRHFDVTAVWTHGNRTQIKPLPLLIIRLFVERRRVSIAQRTEEYANVCLVRQGLLGCSPIDPAIAFSFHTLELYHRLPRRHPRLGDPGHGASALRCSRSTLPSFYFRTLLRTVPR